MHARGVKVSRELIEAEVLDLEGKPRRVGTLWAERPAVIVWLRHYG